MDAARNNYPNNEDIKACLDYVSAQDRADRARREAVIAAAQEKYQRKKAPLWAALRAKDEDAAEALLDGGANPNEVDGRGRNALHVAAEQGCRPPLLTKILDSIDDVNATDNDGDTALTVAIRNNQKDVIQILS